MMDPDGNPGTNDFPAAINNSWLFFSRGYTGFYSAVDAWRSIGIIPVFCAANFGPGPGTTRSPADYNNCISVGGTNSADGKYTNTSEGPSPAGPDFPADQRKPDFSAPGELVISSVPGGGFGSWSGTSMATPHITGTVALMLEANSSLTYDQIYAILKKATVDLGPSGYDSVFGYGRINTLKSVEEAFRAKTLVDPDSVLVTTESGGIAEAHISLATQPTSDVRLSIRSSDTTEGIPLQSELTFTSSNWSAPQTIQIRGVDDSVVDAAQAYQVTFSMTSDDPLYNNIPAPSILLSNKDDDAAQLTITPALVAFADTQVSCREDARLVLHNTGTGSISVTSITVSDSNFALSPPIVSASIPQGDSVVLVVTFAPLDAGAHHGWVVFTRADTTPADSVELSGGATGASPAIAMTVQYPWDGWRMLSQPVRTNCPYFFSPCPWWLYCYSSPFRYSGGYVTVHGSIDPGIGFWLKSGSSSLRFVGFRISEDTIPLQSNWNLVGSISSSVPIGSIITDPPGLLTGASFFGYNGSYYVATAIEPGYAYWVRSPSAGSMILKSTMSAAQSTGRDVLEEIAGNVFTVTDASGKSQSLYFSVKPLDRSTLERYVLPPLAPDASFDVRFASGRMLEALGKVPDRIPIIVSSPTYPLTIRWSAESQSAAALEIDGREVALEGSGVIKLALPATRFSLVRRASEQIPAAFSLEQNYPNPFNPGTLLRYSLKIRSRVLLKIFDLLGREIITLADGVEEAGVRSVEWDGRSADGSRMAGGVYIYQIEAQSVDGSPQSFRATRKMALVR
jgi:hypothetical protein